MDTALSELENLQVRPNQGTPPTLAQAGHAFQFPSHNVYSGRHPTKRKYQCSICGSTSHNKQNSPFNK